MTYTNQLVPLSLPPEPTQGANETLADFNARHSIWWRGVDVALRQQFAQVIAGFPQAMSEAMPAGSDTQVTEATMLEAMRILKGA